jgi:hypothetical protein
MVDKPTAEQIKFKDEVDLILTDVGGDDSKYKGKLQNTYYVERTQDLSDEEAKHLYFYILARFSLNYSARTHPEKIRMFMNPGIRLNYNLKLVI